MPQTEKLLKLPAVLASDTRYVVNCAQVHVHECDCSKYLLRSRKECPTLNVAFHLKNLTNVTLDFGGASLLLHGKIQPFLLENCSHVTVKNLSIQFERPSFTEMTVLETGDGFMRVRLNPSHTCRVEDGKLIPYCAEWENTQLDHYCMFLQAFDPETKAGLGMPLCLIGKDAVSDLPPLFHPSRLIAEDGGDGTVIFRGTIAPCYRAGAVLALGHEKRVYSSTMMLNCEDIHLENYRVLNGSGMGILPIHTKDIFLHKLIFKQDDGSPFLITNQADAIHAFSCSGKFEIVDSVFEGMIDDALNIHGQFYLLEQSSGNRMVLCSKLNGETAYCPIFGQGDTIGIHKGNTTEVLQKYIITELTVLDNSHVEIAVDREVDDTAAPGSLVENLSQQTDITIRNCVFQHANSHLRFQSAGKIRIENCRIAMPVLLTGDAFFWYESSGVTDMEIRNTAFVTERGYMNINPQVLPSESVPFYHRNIRFVDCTFESQHPLTACMADGIVFERTHNASGHIMTLNLTNCGSVNAPGCMLERKTEKKDTLKMN